MAQPATALILAEVDDAERAALVAACTAAGFSPTVEPSAEVATGKLGQKRFDVLVIHMGTPGGALACMRARGKLLRIRIPVIALADTEDDAAFARAYRAGADDVLALGGNADLTERLRSLPKPSIPQPGNARGDAVVADADRTRGEVIERVLRDAGFRVEVVVDGFAARLQAGRPSLKVCVVDASLDDVPALIVQTRAKGARCAWVVRARPEILDDLRRKVAHLERVAVVSAYGPPDDVLFETNRMIEPRASDGRADPRLLHGTIVRLEWPKADGTSVKSVGYTYNVSPLGLFVRTVLPPSGDVVHMEVSPPGTDTKVRLEGKVAWRREFGTTRKEPVPAGYGVHITGGDIGPWAEACPKVPSLRPPMPEEPRPPAPPRAPTPMPKPGPSERPLGVVAPTDVDILPRDPQSSVEEMLASVLNETIPGDDSGAVPLSIDGGTVVELKDGGGDEADRLTVPGAMAAPPEAKRQAPKAAPVAGPATAVDASTGPEIESRDITPASLGFLDAEDVESFSVPPMEPKPEELAKRGEPVAAAASIANVTGALSTASPVSADSGSGVAKGSGRDESIGTSDTIPAPSLEAAQLVALALDRSLRQEAPRMAPPAPRAISDEDTAPPARVAPVSSVPPSSGGSRSDSMRVPTQGISPLVWVGAAIVLGGAAAVFAFPKHGAERSPQPVVERKAVAPPAPAVPEEPAATASAAEAVPASAAASEPPPSAGVVASAEPSSPPSSAVAAEAAPSATATAFAPAAAAGAPPAAAEASAEELATLQKGQGFLFVASPLSTNVYVYGLLAGTTNQRLTTKCGPRFLRLGTAPGAWQSEGVVQIVKCGALTRVEMGP